MKKLLFLILIACGAPVFAKITPELDTPQNRELLKKIEKSYNAIHSLKAKFTQFNSKIAGDLQSGNLLLKKPFQMRLIYEKGSPLEFYAFDEYLVYYDKEEKEPHYFYLNQTPLYFILQNKISFETPDFIVSDIKEDMGDYLITVYKKDAEELGTLTLVVDAENMLLRQWEVVDYEGIKSTVSLFDTKINTPIDSNLFIFKKK